MVSNTKSEQLAKGLYQIGSVLGPRYLYQYLLTDDYGTLLIDAGMAETPEQVIFPFLEENRISAEDLDMVLISHSDIDHFSGLKAIREKNRRVKVMAHELDVPWIESKERILKERYFYHQSFGVSHDNEIRSWFEDNLQSNHVDISLKGGETIKLGPAREVEVIHIPGHSHGHLAVYDQANRAAIIIDGILWKGLYDMEGKVISPPPYIVVKPYVEAIEKIMLLDIDFLLTGHYDIMRGEQAYQFLRESKDFVFRAERVIEELVKHQSVPISLMNIVEKSNELLGPFTVWWVDLVMPVYAHLTELEQQGKIHRCMKGTIPHWFC